MFFHFLCKIIKYVGFFEVNNCHFFMFYAFIPQTSGLFDCRIVPAYNHG
jgi:hypothetical protein